MPHRLHCDLHHSAPHHLHHHGSPNATPPHHLHHHGSHLTTPHHFHPPWFTPGSRIKGLLVIAYSAPWRRPHHADWTAYGIRAGQVCIYQLQFSTTRITAQAWVCISSTCLYGMLSILVKLFPSEQILSFNAYALKSRMHSCF